MILSILSTSVALYASSQNYPGGTALHQLTHRLTTHFNQELLATLPSPYIHIDVLPAQTGVTRFGETVEGWRYDKSEDLKETDMGRFTHLLTDKPRVEGFTKWFVVKSFDKIDWLSRRFSYKAGVYVHERQDYSRLEEVPLDDPVCKVN